MSLQEIYQEILLTHNERPNNFEIMDNSTYSAYGNNPFCGDEVTIFINKSDNDIIKKVSFIGESCAICKASASIMTEYLKNISVNEAKKKAEEFINVVTNDDATIPDNFGELEALTGVKKFPARLKCATLPWHTFLNALANKNNCSVKKCHTGCTCSC